MESWTLILILMSGGPRAVTTINGYTKQQCDVAAYTIATTSPSVPLPVPQPKGGGETFRAVAWCIPGPSRPQ